MDIDIDIDSIDYRSPIIVISSIMVDIIYNCSIFQQHFFHFSGETILRGFPQAEPPPGGAQSARASSCLRGVSDGKHGAPVANCLYIQQQDQYDIV